VNTQKAKRSGARPKRASNCGVTSRAVEDRPRWPHRLEDLEDAAPIFISPRRRQLGYSGFGAIFKRLLAKAQRNFGAVDTDSGAVRLVLPDITPHTIRHLHTTFRVKKVRELLSTPAERERALEALVDDLGWRSAEMLKTYDHAITKAELRELMA